MLADLALELTRPFIRRACVCVLACSWRVVRSQVPLNTRTVTITAPVERPVVSSEQPAANATTVAAPFELNDDWGSSCDDWSLAADDGDALPSANPTSIVDAELRALLAARDSTATCNKNSSSDTTTKSTTAAFPPAHSEPTSSTVSDSCDAVPCRVAESTAAFEPWIIEVDYEPPQPNEAEDPELVHARQLFDKYRSSTSSTDEEDNHERGGGGGGGGGGRDSSVGWAGEEYESAPPALKALVRFQQRVRRSPEQCVRYCFDGEPLWLTPQAPSRRTIPACEHCRAPRVFELQLMPHLIFLLNHASCATSRSVNMVEFGTVAVFSCSASCSTDNQLVPEWLVVQHEPGAAIPNPSVVPVTTTTTTSSMPPRPPR